MNIREATKSVQSVEQMAKPLTGNEAIARGAWEAGVRVAAAYPGTPSTEILENLGKYPAGDIAAQWATNEKVSLDVVCGSALSGVRSMASMKHVGLNVAADTLMSQTYIGVHAGLVIVVCDDPGIHSSQNEQDTRILARFANAPVLEPSDAQEAHDFTKLAFDISEEFDTPVIVRSTTRLSHTRSSVFVGKREEHEPKGFVGNSQKTVAIPANARRAHPKLFEREARLKAYFDKSPLTQWEKGETRYGIITHGTPYLYVKEVAGEASTLKLAASYPLAEETVRAFAASVDRLLVVEELEPVIEEQIKAMGIACEGKAFFPRAGELSPEIVREGLAAAGLMAPPAAKRSFDIQPVVRPPVLCAGCPHTSSYMALRAVDGQVAGDIGCYTLAAVEPLRSIDTTICMGASIANAVGMALAGTSDRPIIATIGDSTFLHSGIPPLIDAVYNKANITVVILDNKITAMTGGQHHPGTGYTLRGEKTHQVDYVDICKACGVDWLKKVDPYDVGTLYRTIREATEYKGVSVVIGERPCVLDPVRIKGEPMAVNVDNCVACQTCMNLGCPAITWTDEYYEGHRKVKIDAAGCIGCSICAQICPSDCIQPVNA